MGGWFCRRWRIPGRRKEEFAGGGPETAPEGTKDFIVFAWRNILRAKREAQRQIEADPEIHHERHGNSKRSPNQGATA